VPADADRERKPLRQENAKTLIGGFPLTTLLHRRSFACPHTLRNR